MGTQEEIKPGDMLEMQGDFCLIVSVEPEEGAAVPWKRAVKILQNGSLVTTYLVNIKQNLRWKTARLIRSNENLT